MDLNQTNAEYQAQIRRIAKNGQITNLDEFQDGRVVRNLLEQGHSPENIEQAIAKFSPAALRQAAGEQQVSPQEYAANLINKGQNVINAMNAIKEIDVSKLDGAKLDSFSEYKQLVRQHMEEKGGIALNSKMDTDMAFKMFQLGHSQANIEEAILKMSPVAQEAGRSPEKYSEYVMSKAAESWGNHLEKQSTTEASYSTTAKEYLDRKEAGRAALNEGRSEAYQDGRIIRELMDKGHDRDNLIKAVAENAVAKEDRTPDGYAKYIVNSVTAEIRAEQNIRSFDASSLEQGTPLTLQQEYLQRAQKLFTRSQGETYNSFIDDRIVTSLVKDGLDPENIKEVIAELSPAGKRPGIVLDYPDKVMERANERITYEQELDKRYPAVAYDYIHNAETLKNANPGRDYSDYMDGKIATRLLEKGHDKENVQKVLGGLSIVSQKLQEEKGWDGDRYGRVIVNRAIQSIERYEAAKSIEPKENPEIKAPTVTEEYQHHLKTYIDKNTNLNANTDIQISKALTAQGYTQDEIIKAVLDASPVAIEAGRKPENYADYVKERVARDLEKEAASMSQATPEKSQRIAELSNVVVEIGMDKPTVAQAYKLEAAKEINQEKGWRGQESDTKIAQSLLVQGYDKGKITAVIGKQSPEIIGKSSDEAKKYSAETTKKAQTPEIKKQMPAPSSGGMKM